MYVRNQRVKPLKRSTGSNLADAGRIAVHAHRGREAPGPGEVTGREATRKVCGVLVEIPRDKAGHRPHRPFVVIAKRLWPTPPAGHPGQKGVVGSAAADLVEPSL